MGAELFNASVTGRVFANGEMTSLNGDGSLRLKQSLVRLEVSSCSIDATGARTTVIMDFRSASATSTAG